MNDQDLLYQIALTQLPGVGNINAKNLISYSGSVEAVFKIRKPKLLKIPGIGPMTADAIVNQQVLKRAEEELIFIEKNKIEPLFFLDDRYPKRLLNCNDSPILLYSKGNCDMNGYPIIGIVGTRKATDHGKYITEQIVSELKAYDPLLISGLAYGIDIYVHRAAIKENIPNVAVVGHSLDRIYPPQHSDTAKKILENGALLSEYISGTKPDKENFPMRNRIVAGMSDVVILVESDIKGGAVITAELANGYHRDVFAVPGRVGDKYSSGCNNLIREHKANIYTSVQDLADHMNWNTKGHQPKQQRELLVELSAEEKELILIFQNSEEISIERLMQQMNMSSSKVASTLLELEFKGMIRSLPGKRYALL